MTGDPRQRLTAFGDHLVEVHDWLRAELARLRGNVDSYLAAGAAGGPPRTLLAHCLAFCSTLTMHHTGEDSVLFPVVAREHPELRPVLEELTRDHHVVDQTLRRLDELLQRLADAPGAAHTSRDVKGEIDGLAAILEAHFAYEEKRLVPVLNAFG